MSDGVGISTDPKECAKELEYIYSGIESDVIISVGGAEGTTYITNEEAANQFATSLISIIEEYGFEGVDIDFEGGAVSGTDYIAEALRTVRNHFGEDFIITMAPETYYFQDTNPNGTMATSAYYRLAYKIRDILTICSIIQGQ